MGSPAPHRPHWLLRGACAVSLIAACYGLDHLLHATLIDAIYLTLVRICIYAIAAASLNLINGVTGQFSLGHSAFMVIGAYTSGWLSLTLGPRLSHSMSAGASNCLLMILGVFAAVIAAALAGFLVGLPALRLRGDYLAIATLGFGEITRAVFSGWDALGGATGIAGVPSITNLFWALLVAIVCITALRNLQWSGIGRDLLAVREDEIAARAVGVNVVRAKVTAFVVSAALAGVSGVLLVHFENSVIPAQAGFVYSIQIVVMVVLGGMGSLTGAVLGAAILMTFHALVQNWSLLSSVSVYENTIFPVLLLLLMLVRREGLLGTREWGWRTLDPLLRWRRPRAA